MVVVFMLAAAVVQAELQMNSLKDGPLTMKNPSAMLTELEGMVISGETPAFDLISNIKSTILGGVFPGLQAAQDAAVEDTATALGEIDLCNNRSKTKEGEIAGNQEVAVNTARSGHAACRDAEMALHHHNLTGSVSFIQGASSGSDSYCVKLGKFLHLATALAIPAGSTRADSVLYVKGNAVKNMCDISEVTELEEGCNTQETALADKKAECATKQGSFEFAFCTWKTVLESNCKVLHTCYSEAAAAYDNHVNVTRTRVKKWDVETGALRKILCFCDVWLSGLHDGPQGDNRSKHNATHFDVCTDRTHVPDDMNYGTPADKATCLLTSVAVHPGTSAFITQEYNSFNDFVEPVVPCPGATTAAPTTVAP